MIKFYEYLRKFKLDNLIYVFSNTSRLMFNEEKFFDQLHFSNSIGSFNIDRGQITVTAWSLNDIVYHAVMSTNDYRGKSVTNSDFLNICNAFNEYSNQFTKEKYSNISNVQILYGLSQKQFWLQRKHQILAQMNRNIELLGYIPTQIASTIPIEKIIYNKLGISFIEFNKILFLLYARGSESIDFTNISVDTNLTTLDSCYTKENIERVINYLTVDYTTIQNSPLKENVSCTRPFIKTSTGKVYIINQFFLAKKVADGAYWLIRDYYKQINSNEFNIQFGEYFEKYLENVFKHYLNEKYFKRLKRSDKEKTADWVITTTNYVVIIEQKTSLASLTTKLEYPSEEQLDNYLEHFVKAFIQLDETEKRLYKSEQRTVIKVALHYETLYIKSLLRDRVLDLCNGKIYSHNNYFLVGISEIESLIHLLSLNEKEYENVLYDFINIQSNASLGEGKDLEHVLMKHNVLKYDYVFNVINHFDSFFSKEF